ncbi:hypothetical protein ACHAWF_008194 [Thalassiosira exigua]
MDDDPAMTLINAQHQSHSKRCTVSPKGLSASPRSLRSRPASPNSATSTGRCPSSPKGSSPSKHATTFRSPNSKMRSMLAFLVVFSVVMNIIFVSLWQVSPRYGKPYEASHYGVGGADRSTDAAWNPPKDGSKMIRVFGGGTTKRRVRERKIDNRRDVPKNHISQTAAQQKRLYNATSSKSDPARKTKKKASNGRLCSKASSERRSLLKTDPPSHLRRSFQKHSLKRTPLRSLTFPARAYSIKHNGMVLLDGINDMANERVNLEEWFGERHEDNEIDEEDLERRSQTAIWDNDEECAPVSDWQTTFHPTCNSFHEMDISPLLINEALSLVSRKGFWRNAWKVDVPIAEANGDAKGDSLHCHSNDLDGKNDTASNKYAVLKSLRYIHQPDKEVFELSRVEAVSLDVLTPSRYTIDIFGFCGSSSVQEFAGGDLKKLLPVLDPFNRLRMAAWVAEGVADVHAAGVTRMQEDNNGSDAPVTMIHNDINMDNVLLGHRDGVEVPVLNDFNIAVFLKKHKQTGAPCRFRGRFFNPQWMSPEQQKHPNGTLTKGYLNEKIDIYGLGNILYKIAVGHSPWKAQYKQGSRITPEIQAKIMRAKQRGGKPRVPSEVRQWNDTSIQVILSAMDGCYRNDPGLRPSARELATYLKTWLDAIAANASMAVNSTEIAWVYDEK